MANGRNPREIAEDSLQKHHRSPSERKPTFRVSAKVTTGLGAEVWMQLGKAWQQPDGKIIVQLLTIPVRSDSWDGGVVLFPWEDD